MELYHYYSLAELPIFFNNELDRLSPSIDHSVGFQNKKYINDLSDQFKLDLNKFLEEQLKKQIKVSEGWINYIKHTGTTNGFDWHNESGVGGIHNEVDDQFVCIIWLHGDTGCGGEFKFIHDETNEITVVPFSPPGFMVISKNTLHAVDHYSGSNYRISLNLNFE
jgi:hypothetical protein